MDNRPAWAHRMISSDLTCVLRDQYGAEPKAAEYLAEVRGLRQADTGGVG